MTLSLFFFPWMAALGDEQRWRGGWRAEVGRKRETAWSDEERVGPEGGEIAEIVNIAEFWI